MQSRISRIRAPKGLVREIVKYLLSQVGIYDDLSENFLVPAPPRTKSHIEDLDLKVEIVSPSVSDKLDFEAKYDPTNSVLYVNLPYFESAYEGRDLEQSLFKVVAHELVHVYQILYTRARDNNPRADSPTAGLPALKERTPQYRQETGDLLHHRLDDNEFYPRLEDTINAIEFVSRRKPSEIENIVSYVIGQSNRPAYRSKHLKEPMAWLKDLGKYAPKKFFKAVRKIKNEFPETAKTIRQADFFRQVSPPDELSTYSNGTPTSKSTDLKDKGEGSQMPNGDGARNIGRPSPDSPNLKSRNLDRSESYGRTPAEGFDGGYVHDSGSGSARVIPYDSGFANNSSPLRTAAPPVDIDKPSGAGKKNVPVDEKLWAEIQALAKGESSKSVSRGKESVKPVNDGKGFATFPSAYANGWALAQYKRLGGKWKKQSSDFKMPRKWDKEHCESKTCDEMGFSEKASCRPYKDCYSKEASSLVPPPPSVEDLVCQLPSIIFQYENRYNSEKLQPYLDECFWRVFDAVLTSNGHDSMGLEIKDLGESLRPIILSLKDHFNLLRPKQLADMMGVPFKCDYLETAQSPSYPSGHTVQAYYISHILSDKYPQLRDKFFAVAKMVEESRIDRGVHFISDNEAGKRLAKNLYQDFSLRQSSSRVAYRYLRDLENEK